MSKHCDESYWQAHIEFQKQSGLTKAEYCRQQGISISTFYGWRKKLGKVGEEPEQTVHPVIVTSEEIATEAAPEQLSLVLPGGYQLSFCETLASDSLMKFVRALTC